jgi:hypothetical protein
MFNFTAHRLGWLNGLLTLALLSQLLSGCPNHILELGCLELSQPCYRVVVRRWRQPLHQAPFDYQLSWLIHWLICTGPRWLIRCGLLALLLWKRTAYSPLVWGLLAGPLIEALCLGLGLLCHCCWRRRWWSLAHWLDWSYGWTVVLLLVASPSAKSTPPLLMGSLLISNRGESLKDSQQRVGPGKPVSWAAACQMTATTDEGTDSQMRSSMVELAVEPHQEVGGGSIQIVQDEEAVCLLVQGLVVLRLPRSDRTGRRWLVQMLVYNERLSPEEAVDLLGLDLRTVQRDQAAYEREQDSVCLVDRRRFNLGQRTAYRVTGHIAELISQWVLNLLTDEPNNGRHLEAQLERVLDDRTIDRALERLGLSAAEAAGLRQRVQSFIEAVRQAAYWAGVEQRPLTEVSLTLPDEGWEQQVSDRATLSLATLHLVSNGAYEAARGLLGKRQGLISAPRAWHTLLTYLTASGGARLSQAKQQTWASLTGLLGGRLAGVSASFLRQWVVEAAEKAKEKVTVQRSDGREETITRLRAYQEESVAQRVRHGLVKAQAIRLDCYVNGVSRREAIVRAWHGTKHWAVKAFRRDVAQDAETDQAVTCPLSPSDVTPLTVLKQVLAVINGGLDRARAVYRLACVTADRWWSVADVLIYCLDEDLGLLCWAKAVKTVVEALEAIDETDPHWKEIKREVVDPDSDQVKEEVVGHRLETELTVYGLPKPVRAIVDWDGKPGGRKVARLAVGVANTTLETEAVCDELRFRQRVEILIKFLHRWLQLPNFGGGKAIKRPDMRVCPSDEEALKKLETERKKTATRLRNAQARLEQVEAELKHLTADGKPQPRNSLGLGVQDLRSLSKRLRKQIERATAKLQELEALIAWGKGQAPAPEREPEYELDLTRETILTQLKLDVFTAYETLVDEFIKLALKPVLREEAEWQAAERRRLDKRSTAKGQEGEPLCTDVETLYQTKAASLERETILERLLNQPGRHLYHPGKKILLTVAQPFADRRMQAAYERYCFILNRRQIHVPIDGGEEWLLLFTYEKPSSSGDKFK